jgi:phosphoesterase RecJ-like protein
VLNRIAKVLSEKDRIVISTHVNPDGDAIGSSLALRLALEGMGKTAWCIHPDATPEALSFLDPEGTIRVYDPESCATIFKQAQVHCTVDVSEPKRIGPVWEAVQAASLTKAIIDHHPNGAAAVDYAYIQPEASATGVLIYRLLEAMGRPLTPRIADCLYAAIMTDTGGFRFSNTNPEAFRIAAALVDAGAAPQGLYSAAYERDSMAGFACFRR